MEFMFQGMSIRTEVQEQEPLFCLSDVAKALEFNGTENIARQIKAEFCTPVLNTGMVTRPDGSSINATFVTEPQLYFVIMRSRAEKAREFRQWVDTSVLPVIKERNELKKENEMMPLTLIDVHENAGKLVTTSRNVAMVFNKEHYNVTRDIRNILGTVDRDFAAFNFECAEFKDKNGDMRPEYLLTRDGCMLLIMGYTGAKAMQLKTAYIKRFNEMERGLKELKEQALKNRAPALPDFTNPADAARAWAVQYEEKQKAIAERDEALNQRNEAVRTKAMIGSRREATAMVTASILSRANKKLKTENDQLKNQLGLSNDFKACKAIDWLPSFFEA